MGKQSAILNTTILLVPICFGLLVALLMGQSQALLLVLGCVFTAAYVLLLLVSKLPKLRQRDYISFGFGGIAKQQWFYIGAYFSLFFALSAWVCLILMAVY